jgi:DNA-binding beta-propeller fold protein YncE
MPVTTLGHDGHVYEWVEGWAELPDGVACGYTHGVCEDAEHRILVFNMSKDAVLVLDAEGRFIRSWGAVFAEGAHGMHLSREGAAEFLYLTDIARHKVYKTTLEGELLWELAYPEESGLYEKAEQFTPTNVAVAPNGDFYVADGYGRSYVHHYTPQAVYVRSWGGAGSELGQLDCPHGIWIDTRDVAPRVLVADRKNVRLQYFDLDGTPLGEVARDLRHPCHFDERGGELLIPDLFGRVTIFDANDHLITHLGDNPGVETRDGYPNLGRAERRAGRFISPHAAIWDHAGNIFVVEWIADGRITKLRRL